MSAANLLAERDVITVEQFLEMDLPDSCEWLLVHGTVVSVTLAKFPHSLIQHNIQLLLSRLFEGRKALVFAELPYELDSTNSRQADVGVLLSLERGEKATQNNCIVSGAPELVVEVMSRSNLPYNVDQLERDCLASDCLAFWKVVIKHRKRLDPGTPDYSVHVGRMIDGRLEHAVYQRNDTIPVELAGISGNISVNDIFAGVL